MKILLLVVAGLAIGVIGGMIGIGGGVLLIPTLTLGFNFDQRKAAAMSLAILAPPVTLPGVWQYYTQGHLKTSDLIVAGVVSLMFGVGAYFGAWHQASLAETTLKFLFGLLLLYVAVRTLLDANRVVSATALALISLPVAWIIYLSLRAIGRKHLQRPDLGEEIRRRANEPSTPNEYYI
jgi:uncharacterized membrane protein YfcA